MHGYIQRTTEKKYTGHWAVRYLWPFLALGNVANQQWPKHCLNAFLLFILTCRTGLIAANYNKLAEAADISIPSLKKYLSILEQTYMLRLLPSASTNLKKRLIKSPKIYLRDSGILHALLDIENFDSLLANPVVGASWEGFVIENIIGQNSRWKPSFLRTSNGAEIDLLLERGGRRHLFECKFSKAPKPSRGFYELADIIKPETTWVVAPVDESYEIKKGIVASPPEQLIERLDR